VLPWSVNESGIEVFGDDVSSACFLGAGTGSGDDSEKQMSVARGRRARCGLRLKSSSVSEELGARMLTIARDCEPPVGVVEGVSIARTKPVEAVASVTWLGTSVVDNLGGVAKSLRTFRPEKPREEEGIGGGEVRSVAEIPNWVSTWRSTSSFSFSSSEQKLASRNGNDRQLSHLGAHPESSPDTPSSSCTC
jgi:hypothetical protein